MNLPPNTLSLAESLARAEAEGKIGAEVDAVEKEWMDNCDLITFDDGELDKQLAGLQLLLKDCEHSDSHYLSSLLFLFSGCPHLILKPSPNTTCRTSQA